MKKTYVLVFVITVFSMLYACRNGHSKVYSNLEKEATTIEGQIMETEDCDDLQMLSFSIMGFRSDFENARDELTVTENEALSLDAMANHLESVWHGKSFTMGCDTLTETSEELDTAEDDDTYEIY